MNENESPPSEQSESSLQQSCGIALCRNPDLLSSCSCGFSSLFTSLLKRKKKNPQQEV